MSFLFLYLVSAPFNALFEIAFSTPNGIGISGFIYTTMVVALFQSFSNARFLLHPMLLNFISWMIARLCGRGVSFIGHCAGIFSGFCCCRAVSLTRSLPRRV